MKWRAAMHEQLLETEHDDPGSEHEDDVEREPLHRIADQVGHMQTALEYFYRGLYVDLADLHHNTSDGVHIASAGGMWNAIIYGFGGMEDHNRVITFDPRLPFQWRRLAFRLNLRGSRLKVDLVKDAITLTVEKGDAITVHVRGQSVELLPGEPVSVPLDRQGPPRPPRSLHLPPPPPEEELHPDGTIMTSGVPTGTLEDIGY